MEKVIIGEDDFLLERLTEIAQNSTCVRSKCGSVIYSGGDVIGAGWNSQPNSLGAHCDCFKDTLGENFKSDKTCCVHAEQRAIMDALKHEPDKLRGSHLFFIRLDENNLPKRSGKPYCTICSKMALDVGIATFSLWQEGGWVSYDTKYYNKLSFEYNG